MSIVFRAAVAAVAACLAGCVPNLGDQTIHGTAILVGQADSSAITVCGACPYDGGGRTCFCTGITDAPVAADGGYTLHQEVSGPNRFTATAASTLEGSVSFVVDGTGDVDAPTVMLTPVGSVMGTVAGLPDLGGVVVAVDGSSDLATTDATGAFAIASVESGPQSLTAFQPGSPASAAAHATVVVPYAAPVTVALELGD